MTAERKKERYEVLFEEISSNVQAVLEGHTALDQDIQALRRDVGAMRKELGYVGQAVGENSLQIQATSQALQALVKRFDIHQHATR